MFEKILLAVDGSEPSERAIAMTKEIASKFAGEVFVLHVWEHSFRGGAIAIETAEDATKLVEEFIRSFKDAGVSARGEVRSGLQGRVASDVLAAAEAEGSDLIVMGSRGLSDLKGLLVGSVTHKVLHLGNRPVLVVR